MTYAEPEVCCAVFLDCVSLPPIRDTQSPTGLSVPPRAGAISLVAIGAIACPRLLGFNGAMPDSPAADL
jgi:hypothetical protein